MKKYCIAFLSLSLITSVSSVFGLIFENATPYPMIVTLNVGTWNKTFGRAVFEREDRIFSIAAHSHLFIAADKPKEGSIEIVTMTIMKDGIEEAVDFQQYKGRPMYYWIFEGLTLSVVPWGKSYRLVRLIQ